MTILVTGANGQLGNEMRIISRNSTDHYIYTDVNQVEGLETTYLDITDLEAIRQMVKDNNVNAIVNCAAWTNVDGAEDPEKYPLVEKLNATAPENLAKAMKEVGGWLVQISTDYVFGKEPYNTPCKEDQTGTPTGVYGATKLLGEQKIQQVFGEEAHPLPSSQAQPHPTFTSAAPSLPHTFISEGGFIIIRTAWLYSEFGKNFCKTMLNLTATKPQLKVVFDQCGTPTYAYDLAAAIVKILATVAPTPQAQPALPHSPSQSEAFHAPTPLDQPALPHSPSQSEAFHAPTPQAQSAPPHSPSQSEAFHAPTPQAQPALPHSPSQPEAFHASIHPLSGIYHFSNEGVCSWFDFTKMIADFGGHPHTHCDIQPCHSSEFPSPVTRPSYSVLDKTKIKETFGIKIPYWTESLKVCIQNLQAKG